MPNQDYLDRIIRYEDGEMEAAERKAFEEALSTDEALQEAHTHYQDAQLVVDQMTYEELRGRLRKMEEKPIRVMSVYWRMAAAAIWFLLVATILFRLAFPAQNDSLAGLADIFYDPPALESVRSINTENPNEKLVTAWQDQDYNAIISRLEDTALSPPQRILLAHAYYASEDWTAAIIQFSELVVADDPRYALTARWNRALSYLQTNELSKSKLDLQYVIENGPRGLGQKAETLLQRIEAHEG